jgi:ATP-dependent DNA ligase
MMLQKFEAITPAGRTDLRGIRTEPPHRSRRTSHPSVRSAPSLRPDLRDASAVALHSRKHDYEVQLYAFDILALDGEDLRGSPLSSRKTSLARLLAHRPDGIFVAPFETGEIGPDLFRAACNMGLEGMASKRGDRPYPAGPSKDWIKVKNRRHAAMHHVMDAF